LEAANWKIVCSWPIAEATETEDREIVWQEAKRNPRQKILGDGTLDLLFAPSPPFVL